MKNRLIVFSAMGIELVGGILAAVYVGQKLDAEYGLQGIFVLSFSIAILVGWLVHIIFLLKKLDKNEGPE